MSPAFEGPGRRWPMQAAVLLHAPWAWRRNEGTPWSLRLTAGLVGLGAGVAAAAALWWLPPRLALIASALLGALALMLWWGHQFAALLRLDHPHAARLVPGHGLALRLTALALWTALAVSCGLVAAAVAAWLGGGPGGSVGGPRLVDVMRLATLGAGAALLAVAAAVRWWWLWVLFWLIPALGGLPGVRAPLAALAAPAREQWQALPLLASALALLAMGVALASLFGRGDAAHARAYGRRERMRRSIHAGAVGPKPTLAACGRWGEWLGAPWQRLADAWLARLMTHARHDARSVLARAEVVLMGSQHWVRQLGVLLALLAGLSLLLAWLVLRGDLDVGQLLEHGHVGIGIGLVSMTIGTVISVTGALWASRREQALLMLLPGMPQGAALNRALGWRQSRQCLVPWLITLPAFGWIAWAGDAPQVLVFPVVALAMLAWLWRDTSRQRAPGAAQAVAPHVLCLGLALASIVLLRAWPGALLPGLALVAALSLVLAAWRWRRLSRLPQALPAGRWG